MPVKRYQNGFDYSYATGMAATVELIRRRPEAVRMVYAHPDYKPGEGARSVFEHCAEAGVPCEVNRRVFERLLIKENIFVLGVFDTYATTLDPVLPHIVLVNPGDAGNLGTILRTGLGFGFRDYAIIRPGADIWDPKAIRASMGALFGIRFEYFGSFETYRQRFPDHALYPFMTRGSVELSAVKRPETPFSLVFGNESAGLPDAYRQYGHSVYIRQNREIDSLNLSVAFGIAAYWLNSIGNRPPGPV
jgi:TrmH family RNA methyltransferase